MVPAGAVDDGAVESYPFASQYGAFDPWCVRKLVVERLAIAHAPAEELRPCRNRRDSVDRFR